MSRPKRDVIGAAIAALAAVIRVADIGRRSLWLDEAWLAVGILDGRWEVTPGSLTPVFDALVRASVAVFGRTEIGVRLPAALFGIAAVVLAWRLGRATAGPAAGWLAAAITGLLPIPVYYGKELKPYSAELFLALLVATFVRVVRDRPRAAAGWVGLVLCVAVGMGITPIAAPLVAGAFLVLLPQARRAPAPCAAAAVAAAVAVVLWFVLVVRPYATAAAFLNQYWHLYFLPTAPAGAAVRATLRAALEAATWGLGTALPHYSARKDRIAALPFGAALALVFVMIVGAASLWRRGERAVPLLALVWHALFAAAALAGRYPYGPARIALFFLGPTALLLAAGVSAAAAALPRAVRPVAWLALALPLAWPLRGTWRENVSRPFVREELRPVLDGVRAERRPGDATWVARDARFAFRFYVPDPDPRVEFEVVVGNAAALRRSLAALAARGEGRVWAIFSHDALADEVRVIGALGRLRIERRITATGAGALLLVAPSDHS